MKDKKEKKNYEDAELRCHRTRYNDYHKQLCQLMAEILWLL